MIEHREGPLTVRAVPGPALYFRIAEAEKPRAVLGLLHGYADHSGRYAHVMDDFAERGITTIAIDLRGHGRSLGDRGYCDKFEEFLDDAAELAALTTKQAAGLPQFMLGHSFGGLVSAASALETPRSLRGVLLSSPYFGLALKVPKVKILAGQLASRIYPHFAIPSGLTGADVTRHAERAAAYDADPLGFNIAKARWFTETLVAQERTIAQAPRLKLPLYVSFGTVDKVAQITDAKRFFNAAGGSDKTWDERKGAYHEPLSDPDWADVADVMAKWILARV